MVVILGVNPRLEFIPSSPGVTGLTSATNRSDRCKLLWVSSSGESLVRLDFSMSFPGSVLGKKQVVFPRFVELLVSLVLCF
jgi:hypothetical protein